MGILSSLFDKRRCHTCGGKEGNTKTIIDSSRDPICISVDSGTYIQPTTKRNIKILKCRICGKDTCDYCMHPMVLICCDCDPAYAHSNNSNS